MDGRETSFIIVDGRVWKTGYRREKGYDGGKKVSGIKRHIVVDTRVTAWHCRNDGKYSDVPEQSSRGAAQNSYLR